MSRSLSVTEPHPTVPKQGGFIGGGRGGAGNYHRYSSKDLTSGPTATGPASRISLSKPHRRHVPAGRGGAGNMFHESEEAIFQFDEEMIRKREAQSAPIYHIGRGGAANFVDESKDSKSSKPSTHRKDSTSSGNSNASVHSNGSTTQRVLNNIFGRRSS